MQPTIVCRECGETWPAGAPRPRRAAKSFDRRPRRLRRRASIIEAEKRPLVTYSDGAERPGRQRSRATIGPSRRAARATASDRGGDGGAVLPRRFLRRAPGGRRRASGPRRPLCGVGLPVNLDGLAIEDVEAERAPTFAGVKLQGPRPRSGTSAASELTIPPLAAVLLRAMRHARRAPTASTRRTAPLAAGRSGRRFTLEFDSAPRAGGGGRRALPPARARRSPSRARPQPTTP